MEESLTLKNHLGENLSASLHTPDQVNSFGIVWGHCFTCSRHSLILRRVCQYLEQNGFMVLRFDFSGNGQSQGAFHTSTYSKQLKEIKVACDFLEGKGIKHIGLGGHSLGGIIALLAAPHISNLFAVCALASRATTTTPRFFLNQGEQAILAKEKAVQFTSRGRSLVLTESFFQDASKYNLEEAVTSIKKPIMVVHGDRDEIIPVSDAQKIQRYNPNHVDLFILEGGDHMFSHEEQRQEVAETTAKWFQKHRRI